METTVLSLPDPAREPRKISRFTIVDTMYFQGVGPVTGLSSRYDRGVNTETQPWIRHTKVAERWFAIETGWIKNASLLYIVNDEKLPTNPPPTNQHREEHKLKVLEIRVITTDNSPRGEDPHLYLPPGESLRVCPSEIAGWLVRARKGGKSVRYSVYLLPTDDEESEESGATSKSF